MGSSAEVETLTTQILLQQLIHILEVNRCDRYVLTRRRILVWD